MLNSPEQMKKKAGQFFLLWTSDRTSESLIFWWKKKNLKNVDFWDCFFSPHVTFPKQVAAIYDNMIQSIFQWKTGEIHPTCVQKCSVNGKVF